MQQSQDAHKGGGGRIVPFRRERLQVRLSEAEQVQLVERARSAGYDSVSQYVRAATLGHPSRPGH